MKNYRETLDYLYAHLPMYQRIGAAAYKKDLTNTLALCAHLGNPHRRFPTLHVAGTNGKGSVSHLLAAFCQAAGLKTGLYVSPHYKDFRERIKVDGRYIPRRRVVEFVEKNRDCIEQIQPSFFELCVAMAFDHFARERVDVAVIEVGLGGRLDSTNVITPELSVITNISWDHMDMLGDTLPKIAAEKAGIIKPGVPVVVGETQPESAPVFVEKARQTGSAISFADQHVRVVEKPVTRLDAGVYDIYADGALLFENLPVQTGGPYQTKNIATAVHAWQTWRPGDREPMRAGLTHLRDLTRFMGRWQVLGEQPTVLADSAHNEAGIRSAFERVGSIPHSRLHVVTGFVNDKDLGKVFPFFPRQARYYFAKANVPRGLDARVLQARGAEAGLQGRAYASVKNALKAARHAAAPDDLVLVIGSIFVVAEVL